MGVGVGGKVFEGVCEGVPVCEGVGNGPGIAADKKNLYPLLDVSTAIVLIPIVSVPGQEGKPVFSTA